MTTSIKNKMRKVMQLAHRAYQLKSSSMSWVECLKQAWQVVKLEAAMKTKVFFRKDACQWIEIDEETLSKVA